AGQLGVSVDQVGRALAEATSSSRFIQPNYWRDPTSGTAYQVQVEIPQSRMSSIEDLDSVPAGPGRGAGAPVGDVGGLRHGAQPRRVRPVQSAAKGHRNSQR